MLETTVDQELVMKAVVATNNLAIAYQNACRNLNGLEEERTRYADVAAKLDADNARMVKSIDNMNKAAQERENEISDLRAQLDEHTARYSNKLAPSEIDLILDIRAGKVITHKVPTSFEEAMDDAKALVNDALNSWRTATLDNITKLDGKPPVFRPAEETTQAFEARRHEWEAKHHFTKIVPGIDPRKPSEYKHIQDSIIERDIIKPAVIGDMDAGKAVGWGSLKVERKVEADLNQANEPYRDSEPGEHQEVIDMLNEH